MRQLNELLQSANTKNVSAAFVFIGLAIATYLYFNPIKAKNPANTNPNSVPAKSSDDPASAANTHAQKRSTNDARSTFSRTTGEVDTKEVESLPSSAHLAKSAAHAADEGTLTEAATGGVAEASQSNPLPAPVGVTGFFNVTDLVVAAAEEAAAKGQPAATAAATTAAPATGWWPNLRFLSGSKQPAASSTTTQSSTQPRPA